MKFKNIKRSSKQARALEKKAATLLGKSQHKIASSNPKISPVSRSVASQKTVEEKVSIHIPTKQKQVYFPNNFRFITERSFWVCTLCILAVASCLFLLADIHFRQARLATLISERDMLSSKERYWESIVTQKPHYRDGYMQVALYAYQLGDAHTSYIYVGKTLSLDPNFLPALKLKGVLETQGQK